MPYSVSSTKFFNDKHIKTSNWVGHSELKGLYLLDCFNRKQLIDERDDELNEMPELKTEKIKLKKSKDKNDDYNDTIPMYVRQEINNDAYKTAMDIDIKTFNTFNERKNTTKTKWKAINEVIEETYFIESNIFPIAFVNKCKDNANEAIT